MLIAGCDRGFAGALCFLDPEAMRVVAMIDMPTLTVRKGSGGKRREISPQMLAVKIGRVVGGRQVAMVYIERVSAMPGQAVTGMFQFGRSLGIAEGVVAALGWPIKYVSSTVWKKAYRRVLSSALVWLDGTLAQYTALNEEALVL